MQCTVWHGYIARLVARCYVVAMIYMELYVPIAVVTFAGLYALGYLFGIESVISSEKVPHQELQETSCCLFAIAKKM